MTAEPGSRLARWFAPKQRSRARQRSTVQPERVAPPTVSCRGLTVELGGERVLRDLDLTLNPGAITSLLGASGSGKSTLVKHLLGVLRPDEGTVHIGDVDMWDGSAGDILEVRRNLSALHGGPTIYDGSIFGSLSLRDNLLATLYEKHSNPSRAAGGHRRGAARTNPYLKMWNEGVPRDRPLLELADRARHWLELFDLAEVADQMPDQVAAGLRRRAALAATLSVDVPLYVLDDFDGALDALHRDVVVEAVRGTHGRTGATMLVTTHDQALARAISHRIAVLSDGRIVNEGSADEVLRDVSRWLRPEPGQSEPARGDSCPPGGEYR